MTLSYSRDPFCCYVASQDLGSFWDCHRRAFAHVGGVPATIVYDRTKTVVGRHVGRGQATPLHPEAVAFAAHYGFTIWLAAPGRPQTKGRVERQVELVRSHVLGGRAFASLAEGGCRLRCLAADPACPDPPYPRRGHRRPGRARPGCPWPVA
jgi:transposase